MPASPSDIAKFATDGVVVVSPSDPAVAAAIRAAHIDARDLGTQEIEHFFDSPVDSQAMLDELFGILSRVDPFDLAVEVDQSIGLGHSLPITPNVPCARIVDSESGVDKAVRVRSYAADSGADRYSVAVRE